MRRPPSSPLFPYSTLFRSFLVFFFCVFCAFSRLFLTLHLRPSAACRAGGLAKADSFVVRCLSRRRTSASSVESLCVGGSIRVSFAVCLCVRFFLVFFFCLFCAFSRLFLPLHLPPSAACRAGGLAKADSFVVRCLSRRRLCVGGSIPVRSRALFVAIRGYLCVRF